MPLAHSRTAEIEDDDFSGVGFQRAGIDTRKLTKWPRKARAYGRVTKATKHLDLLPLPADRPPSRSLCLRLRGPHS